MLRFSGRTVRRRIYGTLLVSASLCFAVLYVVSKSGTSQKQEAGKIDELSADHNFFVDVPKLSTKALQQSTTGASVSSLLEEQPVRLVRDLFDSTWINPASGACKMAYKEAGGPLVLAVVISAPDHFLEREAIRGSWARYPKRKADMGFMFLVGRSTEEEIMRNLTEEANSNGDVAISNIEDSYENLSLKTLSAFSWAQSFCPGAQFVLKVDDDVFIQMSRLHKLLQGIQSSPLHRDKPLILGNVASGWKPVRNSESKYYISPRQYNETLYPPFVTGPSYVVSRQAMGQILALAWDQPYISLEDVFVTGILAEKAGIQRRLVMEFKNNAERIPAKFIGCTLLRTISIHKVLPEEQKDLAANARSPQCGPPNPPPKKKVR